jgi:U3 small nucleolar RNA-associated protein 20
LSSPPLLTYLRQPDKERLDPRSYGLQLLTTLGELSHLTEKHNRDVIALFLELSEKKNLPRKTLVAWLSVFAKFISPKSCYASDKLHTIYYDLLSYPDRSIQIEALNCILTYKDKALLAKQDSLKCLLDQTRWRDELTALELEEESHEVVNVVIRILFGYLTEKRRKGGAGGILSAIARCQDEELVLLVDLMLRPFGFEHSLHRQPFKARDLLPSVTEGQQIGFLTLLADVLKSLGPRLLSSWPALLAAIIDCATAAQKKLGSQAASQDEDQVEENELDPEALTPTKLTRSVRQLAIRRLTEFFRVDVEFEFTPFLHVAFPQFISPRLDALSAENTQAPSALLQLFFTWSQVQPLILVEYDTRVLPKILDCIVANNVKPAVVSRIYDLVERLLTGSLDDDAVRDCIVVPHVSQMIEKFSATVDIYKTDTQLGQRHIAIVSQLAPYCDDSALAGTLVDLLVPLLKRSFKQVPDKVKSDLLSVVGRLVPLIQDYELSSSPKFQTLHRTLSQLFQTLRLRQARVNLASLYKTLVSHDPALQPIAELLDDLNAFSTKRIEEPDFDRRLGAFSKIDSALAESLSAIQWLPLLYQMLNSIQDAEELAVRTSASAVLRLFINAVAVDVSSDLGATFSQVLLPALKSGLKTKHELVRAEILSVISHAVAKVEHNATLQDMRVLLANGDEEANFFNNILHLQTHRRTRALRRLADLCDTHTFKNSTLTQILLPVVTVFITNPSNVDHHVVDEAITTTGRLSGHLTWTAYSGILQRYMKAAKIKDENERVNVRAMVAILENFSFSLDDTFDSSSGEADQEPTFEGELDSQPTLTSNGQTSRILDAVNNALLPDLIEFLNSRDSTTEDSTRIPVAIGIAKVARHLPSTIGLPQITRLLTVLSQVFRSKSQDVRDLTREAMVRIAVVLGRTSIPIMIQELRGALTRGPHLHVLAYVVHSLLVHITLPENIEAFENLDDCVVGAAYVSSEVVFGESGKDIQAEGFKTKMREVRSSTSNGLDSFAILARHVSPGKISSVLLPIRSVLQETGNVKTLQQADEVLRRVATGLNSNKHLVPTELVTLCHTMITQNSKFLKEVPIKRRGGPQNDKIVQLKRKVEIEEDHYSTNSYR